MRERYNNKRSFTRREEIVKDNTAPDKIPLLEGRDQYNLNEMGFERQRR